VRPTTLVAAAALACALPAAACGLTPTSTPVPSGAAPLTASPSPATTAPASPSPAPPTPVVTATPAPPRSPAASAAESTTGPIGQSMALSPASVAPGGTVRITGDDPTHCGSITILSNAFPGPQEFAGVPAVTATETADGHFSATVTIAAGTRPGSYPVTARACGGNFGTELTLKVT
jgi:hypothetical protein